MCMPSASANDLISLCPQQELHVGTDTAITHHVFTQSGSHQSSLSYLCGYTGLHLPLTPPNLSLLTMQYPSTVDEALKKEVMEHRMAALFPTPP